VRPVCAAIPRPDPSQLKPYRTGPYAAGLKHFDAGRAGQAADALARAWTAVRAELAGAFAGTACDRPGIRKALARNVFTAPPRALPAQDRFLPPGPVLWTTARARCDSGDLAGAAEWLTDAALAGDADAAAAAAVLAASAGRTDAARALLGSGSAPATRAARAYLDRRPADLPDAGLRETDLPPLARAIADLLRREVP
jgi:hypothetical protein